MQGTRQPSFHQKTVQALAPASRSANTYDGTVIDMLGYEWAEIIVDAGAVATTGTLIVTARDGESAAGSDDAAVTGATMTTITSANDNQVHAGELYVPPRKRYLTVRAVVANDAAVFGIVVKLHGPKTEPVEDPAPAFAVTE